MSCMMDIILCFWGLIDIGSAELYSPSADILNPALMNPTNNG